ncbi:TolC family protein [bacterium]|nr:TolC family protein [bacterium]MBU1652362.1 TolC family protein [bacterium]MBU1882000.1 TolC family protein [bacterium]
MVKYLSRLGLVFALSVKLVSAGDITIHEIIHHALTHHPDAEIADATVSAAEGSRLSGLSFSSPVIALEYEGIAEGSALQDYEERRLTISQELDFPLHILWNSGIQNAVVDRARAESVAHLLDLEREVRLAYLAAWSAQNRVKIQEENAHHLESYASKIERMQELGEASVLEARSARVEAILAKNDFDAAKRDAAVSMKNLQNLAGIDVQSAVLSSPLTSMGEILNSHELDSFASNPEAQELQAEIRAAKYENLIALTGWLPELELAYFQQDIPVEENSNFWGIEVGFSVPLWFWWGGRGEIQTTRAQKRIMENELRAFEIDFASQWNEAEESYQAANEMHQIYNEQLIPLARETAQLAEKSYSLGEATYLEVLQALGNFNRIRLEHLESEVELYRISSEIDRLLGKSIASTENAP